MPALEANIRMHLHDILFPHHEKDAKCLATFPTTMLANLTVNVVRVGYWGEIRWTPLVGSETDVRGGPQAWVLIYRGHMRLLIPESKAEEVAFRKAAVHMKRAPVEMVSLG